MKVIVVDDNKVELREMCRLVECSDLDLEMAGRFVNGKEAYEFLENNEIDIVITDIQMPVMDGIELAKRIKQNRKVTEIIFVSCYDDFHYMRSALKNDVFDYVLKPINKNEFKLVLKTLYEKCVVQKGITSAREEAGKKLGKYQKVVEEEFFRLLFWGAHDMEGENLLYEIPKLQYCSKVTVAKCRIVDIKEAEGMKDFGARKAWLIQLVKQQIQRMAKEYLNLYSVIMSLDEVAVVFAEEDMEYDVEGELICFKQKLSQELGINLSFGISNPVIMPGGLEELKELYRQAQEALGYSFGSKKSCVIRYEDIAFKENEDINTGEILETVKHIVGKGNKEDISPFLDKYFGVEMKRQSYVKNCAFVVIYSIEMVLLEYRQSLNIILGGGMWEKLNEFDTIANPMQWICNMLVLAIDAIHFKADGALESKVKIVEKIKDIIKKRYGDKLTIGMIAEELHYSGKYISEIFWEIEKKSIFEYLTEFRMEVAKELLREKDSKIYMVVEKVGYKRKTHFYDVFKSYVGVAPMEYKEMYSKIQ